MNIKYNKKENTLLEKYYKIIYYLLYKENFKFNILV